MYKTVSRNHIYILTEGMTQIIFSHEISVAVLVHHYYILHHINFQLLLTKFQRQQSDTQ